MIRKGLSFLLAASSSYKTIVTSETIHSRPTVADPTALADISPPLSSSPNLCSGPLIVTATFAKRLQWLKERQAEGQRNKVLRLAIQPGGCQGFSYNFELENFESVAASDQVTTYEGHPVLVVAEEMLQFVKGATVDYHVELKGSAFVMKENPNADMSCSCGTSFSPKT